MLWFTWKIVLLQYRKQQESYDRTRILGCDLLEKSYFCSIANNEQRSKECREQVVIYLKNRTFAVSQTTSYLFTIIIDGLWFTWKIVLLQYRKQLCNSLMPSQNGCDLLEKSYFCSIANNTAAVIFSYVFVVIYLKNRTFAVSQTTLEVYSTSMSPLWFTWKIVLLQYRKQPNTYHEHDVIVVIYLKNRTFAVSQTTRSIR